MTRRKKFRLQFKNRFFKLHQPDPNFTPADRQTSGAPSAGNEKSGESEYGELKYKALLDKTVNALSMISEIKDSYTHAHQMRVAKLASSIAMEMGLKGPQLESIVIAGKLHDLGKINIPADILAKPGRLSGPEMEIIKSHPESGYEVLSEIPFDYPIAKIVVQHHERWNGSGYPHQLSGQNILFEARIIAVADVVEAMSSHRPYRPSLGVDKALEEIETNSGILYDPQVVRACARVLRRNDMDLEKIFEK